MSKEHLSNPGESYSFEATLTARKGYFAPVEQFPISFVETGESIDSSLESRFVVDPGPKENPNTLGNLQVGNLSLLVSARLSLADKSAGNSEFLVVDMRGFSLDSKRTEYTIGPYTYDHRTRLQGGGPYDRHSSDFALVDMARIKKSVENPFGGSTIVTERPFTAISMHAEEPTYINIGMIGTTVDSHGSVLARSSVRLCSDGTGKLLIKPVKDMKPNVSVHTVNPSDDSHQPRFLRFVQKPRPERTAPKRIFDDPFMDNLFASLLGGTPPSPGHQGGTPQGSVAERKLEKTPAEQEVEAEIIALRAEGLDDGKIKTTLVRKYHTDRDDGGDAEKVKTVTRHFARKQEPL